MTEDENTFEVFVKRGISITRGENAKVWDSEGREYIDCVAGHGVANLGHCNPSIVSAICKQSATLITCPCSFHNPIRAEFLEKLVQVTPPSLNKAYLCNSGTEAVEAAIKFARFTTGKTDFIAMMRGFHGRTLGSLSATHKPEYKKDFEPLVPGFSHVPLNNLEKFEAALSDSTAGVILELVQGEGGIQIAEKGFVKEVRRICSERGVMLIIDEVQTGFCRTGKMFACQHYDIEPDILCLAKALGGGFPIGATVCSDNVLPPVGRHGTTFGGNPLACSAGLAAIQFMQEHDLASQAEEKGTYFEEVFKSHSQSNEQVRDFRRMGLMIGIELKSKVRPYLDALQEHGVLALPSGTTVIRLLPPLTISKEELETVARTIAEVISTEL